MDHTLAAVRQARALCAIAVVAVESAKDCVARSQYLRSLARRARGRSTEDKLWKLKTSIIKGAGTSSPLLDARSPEYHAP